MRFRWHPAARLVDAAGQGHDAAAWSGARVLPDRPAVAALQDACAAPAFRIGAEEAPAPLGDGVFETLSGGTSGAPKRILRQHASWIASFSVNAALFDIGPHLCARVAVLGRLVHSLALYGALEGLHLGAEVHLLDGLRPNRQAQALNARQITLLYATPAQLRLLVEAAITVPTLRYVLVGGAMLDAPSRALVQDFAPNAQIRVFYGAAETSFLALADAQTPEGSVGRAYPQVELDLRGAMGEIWARSPYLATAYAGGQGGGLGSDGWVNTGEYGALRNGYLYLMGRAGRMVKIADQTVFPEAVEAFLALQSGISRAAITTEADPKRGHVLIAHLQGNPALAPDLTAALRARFGPMIAPRRLIWRADWPLLPSGKTDLRALEGGA